MNQYPHFDRFPEPGLSLIREQSNILLESESIKRKIHETTQKVLSHMISSGLIDSSMCVIKLISALNDLYDAEIKSLFEASKRVIIESGTIFYPTFSNDLYILLLQLRQPLKEAIESKAVTARGITKSQQPDEITKRQKTIHYWLRAECNILALSVKNMSEKQKDISGIQIHYNLSGENSRININSQDYSINIAESGKLFDVLKEITRSQISDSIKRQETDKAIAEMQASVGKRSLFEGAYFRFIATVADHMQIFGPYIPALTILLQQASN